MKEPNINEIGAETVQSTRTSPSPRQPNSLNITHLLWGETTSPPSHQFFWNGFFMAVLNVLCLRLSDYCGFSYLGFSSPSSLHPYFGFLSSLHPSIPPSLHPCCSSFCPRGPIVPLRLPLIDSRPLKGHLSRIWLDTQDIRGKNVFFKPSDCELHQRPAERLRGLMVQHLCLTRSAKQLFVCWRTAVTAAVDLL